MLVISPDRVNFGPAAWWGVRQVAFDRAARRTALEWSDSGPHPTFADVPEQETTIRVEIDLSSEDLSGPRPGDRQTLTVFTSPSGADGRGRSIAADAVVISVTHRLGTAKSVRVIELVALSSNGSQDPLTISDPP
jgi:hypothetical protein